MREENSASIKQAGCESGEPVSIQLSRENFLRINDGNTVHYGGNQSWYAPDEAGRAAGCGPTAAANILAYLATANPDCRALYAYDVDHIEISEFIQHMQEVYQYVTPIIVPRTLNGLGVGPARIPASLGIPFLGKFAKGVEEFAQERGVTLTAHRMAGLATMEEATDFIIEGLKNDSPVSMLNYLNPSLAQIPCTNTAGRERLQNLQMHWVTITAVHICKEENRALVDLSTWGEKAVLDVKDVIGSLGFGGLIFFTVGEQDEESQ